MTSADDGGCRESWIICNECNQSYTDSCVGYNCSLIIKENRHREMLAGQNSQRCSVSHLQPLLISIQYR